MHVTIEEVFEAYYKCRLHKRSKKSSVEYEMNYELSNYQLWMDLNNMTYRPTTSIAFCVTRPKLREVFAASFRDRVVHHLFVSKIIGVVESRLTPQAYACREGKGTFYGVKDVLASMEAHQQGWYAKCDIKSFFMSINKSILMEIVRDVVKEACTEDTDWWLWLAETIIMHQPASDCELHGNLKLWDNLPDSKSLFKTDGMPIGDLPSQICANLYLAEFDILMQGMVGGYGRYCDDFCLIDDNKDKVLKALEVARKWLWDSRKLTLHPNKTSIQKVSRGMTFTGFRIHRHLGTGKRLVRNAMRVVEDYRQKESHTEEEREQLMRRVNSYCGLLRTSKSWKVRRKMLRGLEKHDFIIDNNYLKIQL